MRLLLDTHVWLWSMAEPGKLNRRTRAALGSDSSELWISPITVWEFLVLVEKRRLRIDGDAETWLVEALASAPMREAPLTGEIARVSRRLELPHDDPADRFIAATAVVLDLTLVTADRRLLRTRELSVLRAG